MSIITVFSLLFLSIKMTKVDKNADMTKKYMVLKSGKTKCARFEKRNVQKSGKTKRSKKFAHTTL